LKRRFDVLLEVAEQPAGVHPKMGAILDEVFKRVDQIGSEIDEHRHKRMMPRTWKDGTVNTMYLD
jgi:hypothetical protein